MVRRLIVAAVVVMTLGVVSVGATGFDIESSYLSITSERQTCDPPPVETGKAEEGDDASDEDELREDADGATADAEASQATSRTRVECQ